MADTVGILAPLPPGSRIIYRGRRNTLQDVLIAEDGGHAFVHDPTTGRTTHYPLTYFMKNWAASDPARFPFVPYAQAFLNGNNFGLKLNRPCECGSEKVYGPNACHSKWCPKHH